MQNYISISWLRISKQLKQLLVAHNKHRIQINNFNSMKLSRLRLWSQLKHQFRNEEISGAGLILQSPVGPFLGAKLKMRSHIGLGSLPPNPRFRKWYKCQRAKFGYLVPLQIVLSGSASIPENKQRGTKVGTFSSVDPNSKDKHTYSIVSGGSGKFELRGVDLYTLTVFDYESSPNK